MIKTKLQILKNANMINEQTYEYTKNVVVYLKKLNINMDTEKSITFITHLALATMRQYNNEPIEKLNSLVFNDLKKQNTYNEATKIIEELKKIAPIIIKDEEDGYLYIHLCNLL